ncbi:septation ring formation regulator [Spiroplasma sp. TIUS-1]|uniref:septation ring formation regulator EzrA n=1 Tax=Spiroplasma sp. TIUS-1 TaxID=216963 RepID=UPI0013991F3A|nr:septation ring formation regulator EzrA [Spiroplasma sp. TIUS-1]QHX36103.1 septation ring formation regulator [Spiroplasma sp. TIUS-1]
MSNWTTMQTVSFSIFVALAVISILFFILLIGARFILKTQAKCLEEISIIHKNPVKHKLQRIQYISNTTATFISELDIWWSNYEHLLMNELNAVIVDLNEFSKEKKNLIPTPKHIFNIKKYRKQIDEVKSKIYIMQKEVENALMVEDIQRTSITFYKIIFEEIRKNIDILLTSYPELNAVEANQILSRIDSLFLNFNSKLATGLFEGSLETLSNIRESQVYMIELIDLVPYLLTRVNTKIPNHIEELREKYASHMISKNAHHSKNSQAFSDLEKKVKLKLKDIKELINVWNMKKALKELEVIFKMFNDFNSSIVTDDKLKDYFIENIDIIREIIKTVEGSVNAIDKGFSNVESINKAPTIEKKEFDRAKSNFNSSKTKLQSNFSDWDYFISRKHTADIKVIKDKLVKELATILNSIDNFENSSRIIEKSLSTKDKYISKIGFIRTLLEQVENKISINKHMTELVPLRDRCSEINANLENFITSRQSEFENKSSRDQLFEEIAKIENDTWELERNLKDCVFADFIAQELLIYLEKYSVADFKIDRALINLEEMYKNREIDRLIHELLNILNSLIKR